MAGLCRSFPRYGGYMASVVFHLVFLSFLGALERVQAKNIMVRQVLEAIQCVLRSFGRFFWQQRRYGVCLKEYNQYTLARS